jgi:hypothetical protein
MVARSKMTYSSRSMYIRSQKGGSVFRHYWQKNLEKIPAGQIRVKYGCKVKNDLLVEIDVYPVSKRGVSFSALLAKKLRKNHRRSNPGEVWLQGQK